MENILIQPLNNKHKTTPHNTTPPAVLLAGGAAGKNGQKRTRSPPQRE